MSDQQESDPESAERPQPPVSAGSALPASAKEIDAFRPYAQLLIDYLGSRIAGENRPDCHSVLQRRVPLPQSFQMEFTAVLLLLRLERLGLRETVDPELPSPQEVIESIASRLRDNPQSFYVDFQNAEWLHRRVTRFWQFVHSDELDVNFAVSDIDDEDFFREIADFLWANRESISEPPPASNQPDEDEQIPARPPVSLLSLFKA